MIDKHMDNIKKAMDVEPEPIEEAKIVEQNPEPEIVNKGSSIEEKSLTNKIDHVPIQKQQHNVDPHIEMQWSLAVKYVKSGILPASYTTPEKVFTGMHFAKELGLKPLTALRQIAVINGTPSLWGDLPLGIVRASGELEYFDEYLVNEKSEKISLENKNISDPIFAAVCEIQRKKDKRKTFIFTMMDKDSAGLGNSPTWKKYPKLMLKYRARSIALKDVFSDYLNGVAIAEHDFNTIPTEGKVLNVTNDGKNRPNFKSANEVFE